MLDLFKRLVREEEGQGMVEYGLIIALIAVVVAATLPAVASALTALFEDVAGQL